MDELGYDMAEAAEEMTCAEMEWVNSNTVTYV